MLPPFFCRGKLGRGCKGSPEQDTGVCVSPIPVCSWCKDSEESVPSQASRGGEAGDVSLRWDWPQRRTTAASLLAMHNVLVGAASSVYMLHGMQREECMRAGLAIVTNHHLLQQG